MSFKGMRFERTCFALVALPSLAAPLLARANSLESLTSASGETFSEALTYDGSQAADGKGLNWTAGLSFLRSNQSGVADRTGTVTGGASYREDYEVGGDLEFSRTPAESLRSWGPDAYFGYNWKFSPDASAGFRVTGAFNQYVVGLDPNSSKTLRRSGSGNFSLNQSSAAFEVHASPWSWISAAITVTPYHYDEDVNRFLKLLDQPQAIETGASGFAATLQGFPKRSEKLALAFYPWDDWEFDLEFDYAVAQSDGTSSRGAKVGVRHDFNEHWKGELAFERDTSPGSIVNLGIVGVSYDF